MQKKENPIPETVAEIRLGALKKNLKRVISHVGKRKIIAVVKADAYGHGAVAVSRCLLASPQIAMLGVASMDEGIALRKAQIQAPLLLMTGCPIDGIPELAHYRLTPAIYDEALLSKLSRFVKKTGQAIPVHVKVDTGMGRLGLSPEKTVDFMQKAEAAGLHVEGLFSHFASADCNFSYAREQWKRFQKIAASLYNNHQKVFCHMANSAAILTFPDAYFDGVRPGLMLYGYSPLQTKTESLLEPVLTVKSRILSIKNVPPGTSISYGQTFVTRRATSVAVVAIGYADGYPRLLSNCGEMMAQGKRVSVIGRVCMDMTLLDVTSVPSLCVGDWVTVMGREGKETIGADRLAEKAQTIPYEILCGIPARIPRVYQ